MGPNTPQTLNVHQDSFGHEVARDIIKLYRPLNTEDGVTLECSQVYTPLVAVDDGDKSAFAKDLEKPVEQPVQGLDKIIFVKEDAEDPDSCYIPKLPLEDATWQGTYGKYLVPEKEYYLKFTKDSGKTPFVAKSWYYSSADTAGVFNTPPQLSTSNFVIKLSDELSYPILELNTAFEESIKEVDNDIYVTIQFLPANTDLEEVLPDSGKTATPLTLFASSYLISDLGTASFLDKDSGSYTPIELKAGVKQPLVLSNGAPFVPLSGQATPISLGKEHKKQNVPVIELNALVPAESSDARLGILPIFVDYLKTDVTNTLQIASAVDLAIFNNRPAGDESDTWWSGMEVECDGYKLYTLKQGLNTIVIPTTCILKFFAPSNADIGLLIGELKLVHSAIFNPQLAYGPNGAKFALDLVNADSASELRANLAKAQEELDILIARKAAGDVAFSEQDIIDAVTRVSIAKASLDNNATSQLNGEALTTNLIGGTSYQSLYITNEQVFSRLAELDPERECYYSDITSTSYGIELNAVDSTDTMLLAKNWFDRQNIANKFLVSEIETANDHLEDYIVVSKTSIL
jgi:hypothetical protein